MSRETYEQKLLRLAKEGDLAAREAVYHGWVNLLYKLCHRYAGDSLLTFDEALSVSHTAFLDAIVSYDPDRGEWKSWLSWKVYFAIKRAREKARKWRGEIYEGNIEDEHDDC